MTMTSRDALGLLMGDRKMLLETLMQVESKSRELVPFKLNPIQDNILINSTGRDVYVKPAQIGASTLFIADFLCDVLTIPGTVAVIISYDEFITGRLLRKARTFYNTLHRRVPTIPKLDHKSTYEMTFPEVNGSFYIGSARSFTFGRGETIHDLLLDEYAFWQPGDAERIFASALQRVPLAENTKVKICSTANGEDNDFHETYESAKDGKDIGRSVFKHHFFPWFMHPEYVMKSDSMFCLPGDDKEVLDNIDPEEEKLLVRFGLSYDQIRWRRYKKAEMASLRRTGETQFLFSQEYPEDDVSCFLSAGDMVYDSDLITEMSKRCYPAPGHACNAHIWYPPEEGKRYLLSIDPGIGITSASVATVWEFKDTEEGEEHVHCATLSGLYEDWEMAAFSKELGVYYNNAIIAAEDVLGIISHLTDYRGDLYYRTDQVTGKVGKTIGWHTDVKTKPYMINEMSRNLHRVLTHDIRLVSQLRNIRWLGQGVKRRAMSIGADDYHDSACIAIVCRDSMPVMTGCIGHAGWSQDWGR